MYLPELRSEISQGDIFDAVPLPYLDISENPNAPVPKFDPVRVILLSHDCEYDKPKTRAPLVAQIRLLTEVSQDSYGYLRNNKVISAFYLPALGNVMDESFVDFSRIVPVPKTILQLGSENKNRLASLTDEARAILQDRIGLFFGVGRGG